MEHFWCTNEPWANTDSQDSTWLGLGGNHHLPPYSILCVILSWDSQVGVPKFSKLGLLQLWRPITSSLDLQSRWGLTRSCIPHQDLFNGMWHTTYTQINQGNSQLLVVVSQIANLTPDPSFGHNLCFNNANGLCKPILDIYVPKYFQWYKELLNPMSFDPCNRLLKIRKSIGTPTLKVGAHFGNVGVHCLTLSCTPESMKCDSSAHSWPAPLQALPMQRSQTQG